MLVKYIEIKVRYIIFSLLIVHFATHILCAKKLSQVMKYWSAQGQQQYSNRLWHSGKD